jgi:nucleoside-diphosphate-sugar epimerase
MNTVHVHDVARAIWHLCDHGNSGEIYNLADQGDTSKKYYYENLSKILLFGIYP